VCYDKTATAASTDTAAAAAAASITLGAASTGASAIQKVPVRVCCFVYVSRARNTVCRTCMVNR